MGELSVSRIGRRDFLKLVVLGLTTASSKLQLTQAEAVTIDDVMQSIVQVTAQNSVQSDLDKIVVEYNGGYNKFKDDYLKRKGFHGLASIPPEIKKDLEDEFSKAYSYGMLIPEGKDKIQISNFLRDYYRDRLDLDLSKQLSFNATGSSVILDGKFNNRQYLLTVKHNYEQDRLPLNPRDKKSGRIITLHLPIQVQKYKFEVKFGNVTAELGSPVKNNSSLDYALFELPHLLRLRSFPNRFLNYDEINTGDEIYVFGIPGQFRSPLLRKGAVSAKYFRTETDTYQILGGDKIPNKHLILLNVNIYGGDSGGIFVDTKLKLGGLIFSQPIEGRGFGVAVRIDSILNDGLAEYIHPKYLPK